MPPEDIIIKIQAQDAASDEFEKIMRQLRELDVAMERFDSKEAEREIARRRHLEANANARQAASNARIAELNKEQAAIERVAKEERERHSLGIQLSKERQSTARKETALYNKQKAAIQQVANEEKARNALSIQLSRERATANRREIASYNKQKSAIDQVTKKFVEGERTKRAQLKQTTDAANAAARKELENIREVNREKARQFRRDERIASERFQRGQSFFGSAALGAGVGANLGQKLQTIIGQASAIAGGLYVVQAGLGSIVRDRARVQRLEVGVRDLTDTFRAQAVLPRLQEIALLPGLDYVTATQAFTRALSGGFTDQQSLRLINQIRNAVALSQGSIEDTNEVLRQFVQIQARDRFDQENLRPILERAPFIRRVIQEEFGTQIGGEIQQVIEQRGITTTEGILRIMERLAAGPVADPTTLQNALDNVRNELILLNNELGRRIQPALTGMIDGFTQFLRFLQGGPGAVLAGGVGGSLLGATAGFGLDFLTGRHRSRAQDHLTRLGYDRLLRRSSPLFGGRGGFTRSLTPGRPSVLPGYIDQFFRDPAFAEKEIMSARGEIYSRETYATDLRERARRQGIRVSRREARRRAAQRYQLTPEADFISEALFFGSTGEPSRLRQLGRAFRGQPGQRIPFVGSARFQNPFGGPGRFRSPITTGGQGFFRQGLTFGTPSIIGAFAALAGGAALGQSSLETRARGGVTQDTWWAPIVNGFNNIVTAGINLGDEFIRLNDKLKDLTTGGIPDFQVLLGDIASRQSKITQEFAKLQTSLAGGAENVEKFLGQFLGRDIVTAGGATTNTQELLRYIIRETGQQTPTDLITDRSALGIDSLVGATAEQRRRARELLFSMGEQRDALNQGVETAATTRGNILARIRALRNREAEIAGDITFRTERDRAGREFQVPNQASRENVKLLKQTREELEKQFELLKKIEEQESKIVGAAENLNRTQEQINEKTILYLRNMEDFTGKIIPPNLDAVRRAFPQEQLDELNKIREAAKLSAITYGELAKVIYENSLQFGLANRKIVTGLGEVRDSFNQLLPAMHGLISGIISPGDVEYRSGRQRRLGLPSERPNITGLSRRGGDLGFAPIDITSGIRQIRRTPGGLTGPLVSGEEARRAAFGAVDRFYSAQAGVQAGAPFDPRVPTTIRGTGPAGDIKIDPVTLDRFRRLNEEWQSLLETLKEFDRTRGILDALNVAPFRGGRIREIADLIVQIGKLRQSFIDLRDARIKAIEESGADDRLKRQLIGLINVPIEQLTRKLRELSGEITKITAQGLAIQTFKDQFNSLIASLLGRRGAHTGVRALGRQLGEFFGRYTVPQGREIIRQRRNEIQREREDLRRQQDEEIRQRSRDFRALQEERARAFEGYFAGTAESLYDQFIAPSILDVVGIESGQSAARSRAFDRLKEDIQRQKESVRENDRLNARQQAEQMLEITREYEREKREIERSYEEQRTDAWKNWVRQQLTDFPKLIVQQLNLQLAARSTNFILNTLGIGGNIPITGPGLDPLALGQGVTQYAQQIGPGLRGSPGGPGTRGGNWFTNILSRFIGGNPASGGSGAGGGALPGSGGFIPLAGRAGGVQYASPIGPGAPGSPPLFANSGASAAGVGANAANAGVAVSAILAAHNIVTGTVPSLNPHNQSLFDDFGGDLLAATGTQAFFDNLIFHNARNDAMARSAGMQAKMRRQAATLGRESAQDIVSNFKEGFEETQTSNGERVYVVPAETTFSMPIIIGDQETRQISYNMDQLMSEGRL